jgi:hypothetical protein
VWTPVRRAAKLPTNEDLLLTFKEDCTPVYSTYEPPVLAVGMSTAASADVESSGDSMAAHDIAHFVAVASIVGNLELQYCIECTVCDCLKA